MRKVISENWLAMNEPFEGHVFHMYLDQHRDEDGKLDPLVTTGCGNLIDPLKNETLLLPWEHPDGRTASMPEIAACWKLVKDSFKRGTMNPLDGGAQYAKLPGNTLRLPKDAVAALVLRRLIGNASWLRDHFFNDFDLWSANAQAASLSMSWAMGADGFRRFPRFCAHARNREFAMFNAAGDVVGGMAFECTVNPDVGTIRKRNAWQRKLLIGAQRVADEGLDPDVLHVDGAPLASPKSAAPVVLPFPNIAAAIRKAIEAELDEDLPPNEVA